MKLYEVGVFFNPVIVSDIWADNEEEAIRKVQEMDLKSTIDMKRCNVAEKIKYTDYLKENINS